MYIEKCKWYNNALSPVMFMIDDFANTWVDVNNNGIIDRGEDWGYAKNQVNSSIRYLEEEILKKFPRVKVTFFVPVGSRVGVIENSSVPVYSAPINASYETKAFFKSIHENDKYELAYHGTTHGKPGKKTKDFVQEWKTYKDLDEALDTINTGKKIFYDACGTYPLGGKYCGYETNDFSDESINRSQFLWWCRYANSSSVPRNYNQEMLKENFEVQYFGSNNVIDLPTTVNGSLFNSALNIKVDSPRNLLRKIVQKKLINNKYTYLKDLMKNNLIISIQEHIAPSRNDKLIQMPNIYDDYRSLVNIFSFLSGYKVWYCTGTELAKYIYARDKTTIIVQNNFFYLELKEKYSLKNFVLTLKFSDSINQVITPSGQTIQVVDGLANIPVQNGRYLTKWETKLS